MRKYLLFLLILISKGSFAQAPQSFKYQAVVRDAAGLLAVNKIISIRTSILSGSASGSTVYTETQTLSTNDYGVVSLNIGAGTLVSGNFSTINWGATTYFVKTELDINGASTYVFMGTSQILSVPYALYAEKTGSSLSDHDTSATNEIQNLSVVGSNLSISGGNTIALPPDADSNPLNELQNLSITGDSLHITNGNSIYLSGAVDLDASPLNEIQNLSLNGDSLKISMGNNVVFPHDNDRDSINEIQNLSINQGTISILNGNSIHLPDSSMTNELQNLNINQGTITISNGNSIHLPDSTATNELQNLSITNGTISLSNGNLIHLPDSSATNEIQNISAFNDTLLSITNGNSIYINTSRSLKFPEGIDGIAMVVKTTNFTVPLGKNFYCTSWYGSSCKSGLPVFSAGIYSNGTNTYTGILVNTNSNIQIVNLQIFSGSSYTVPIGKTLYIKSYQNVSSGACFDVIASPGSFTFGSGSMFFCCNTDPVDVITLPSGSIISSTVTSFGPFIITGYLK